MGNMSKTELAYFNAARAMSELSDHPHHHLGCVVVKGHKIISSGFNSVKKCHPLQARLDKVRYGTDSPGRPHAELSALYPLIKENVDLTGASIFIYRQTKDGHLACAKPCPSCEWLIKQCKIRNIFYTIKDDYAKEKW